MFEILTENEIVFLNDCKKQYDETHSNSFASMQPKLNIPIIEDVPASLQAKGYLEIKREDFENGMELVSIFLKDKFFKYFNINTNQ